MAEGSNERLGPLVGLPSEAQLIEPARRIMNAGMKPWKPGQGGNTNGVSKLVYRSRQLFRAQSEELTERLINLALYAEDERVAAMCTIHALGCAGIRQMDFDPNSEKSSTVLDLSRLSDEQRDQLRALLDAMSPVAGSSGSSTPGVSEAATAEE